MGTPLPTMPSQLILMSLLLTLTPTLLLMTTPRLLSTLLRLVMVLAMLLDPTPWLSLTAVPSTSTTRLMAMKAMLLILPMRELLSTLMPLWLTRLPQSLPMLVKNHLSIFITIYIVNKLQITNSFCNQCNEFVYMIDITVNLLDTY